MVCLDLKGGPIMVSSFNWSRAVCGMAVLALCLLLAGCGKSKVSKENYDKIQNGMSLADVEKLLGKGTDDSGDGANVAGQFGVDVVGTSGGGTGVKTYVWESGNKKITVYFKQDKVVNKNAAGW
jgi:hypothetical protein